VLDGVSGMVVQEEEELVVVEEDMFSDLNDSDVVCPDLLTNR
jgi:hypothetical protein